MPEPLTPEVLSALAEEVLQAALDLDEAGLTRAESAAAIIIERGDASAVLIENLGVNLRVAARMREHEEGEA